MPFCKLKAARRSAALTLAMLVSASLPISAHATVQAAGTRSPTKTSYKVSNAATTTSQGADYVDIAEAAVNFTQGGTSPSCVIVQFSANAKAPSGIMRILTTLDGVASSSPGFTNFQAGDGDETVSRSFIFLHTDVAPGQHTIKVRFLSTGGPVTVGFHSTLVEHP